MQRDAHDSREQVIRALHAALIPLPFVYAAWLEGADAAGRADDCSDIDLWLDVEVSRVESAFGAVRAALERFGPLDVEQTVSHPHPQLWQRFFRSIGLPEFWFVDVVVQQHGREAVFGPDDPFLMLFDRAGVVRRSADTLQSQAAAREQTLRDLTARHWRWLLTGKELRRGHRLEALAYYREVVLADLVTLLRLRSCPRKAAYGLKHIQTDLPASDVQRLEHLYARTRIEDIRVGMTDAETWFAEVLNSSTPRG